MYHVLRRYIRRTVASETASVFQRALMKSIQDLYLAFISLLYVTVGIGVLLGLGNFL